MRLGHLHISEDYPCRIIQFLIGYYSNQKLSLGHPAGRPLPNFWQDDPICLILSITPWPHLPDPSSSASFCQQGDRMTLVLT
jgi:hypothetical protein